LKHLLARYKPRLRQSIGLRVEALRQGCKAKLMPRDEDSKPFLAKMHETGWTEKGYPMDEI